MIRVGTSGWSYDDWVGPFYPPGLEAGRFLAHFVERFSAAEVNSTFYATPPPATVRHWIREARRVGSFELSAKTPRTLTETELSNGPEAAAREARGFREKVAQPLADAGCLGAILIQLPPRLPPTPAILAALDAALVALQPLPCAVELRDPTWLPQLDDIAKRLDARDAAIAILDGPHWPVIDAGDASHAYIRMHGRNADIWRGGPGADDDRLNRYDYAYSEEELAPWAQRVRALAETKDVVRVFFNNHPGGLAARDALGFVKMLADAPVVRPKSPQRTLFE